MQHQKQFQQCLEEAKAFVNLRRAEAPQGFDPLNTFGMIAVGAAVGVVGGALMSGGPDAPETPDYAAANKEGIFTDIETLEVRKKIEAAAKLGTKVTYIDPRTGTEKTADFSGFGDVDQSRGQLAFASESGDAMAKAALDAQKKYGLDYIAQRDKELQAADPVGYALRKKMGEDITADGFGTNLSAAQQQQVTQAERGAQAARGNIFGGAPAAAEAMAVGDAGFRMRQQRLANASAFLAGTTPIAQFGQISGAQQGASQFNPQGIQGGTGLNPNAGQMGTNFALSNWQNKFASFQDERANDPMRMIGGSLMGAGTNMFTGGLTRFAGSFGKQGGGGGGGNWAGGSSYGSGMA